MYQRRERSRAGLSLPSTNSAELTYLVTPVRNGGFEVHHLVSENLANSAPASSSRVAIVRGMHGSILSGSQRKNSFMKVLKL